MSDNIKVTVRVRPFIKRELSDSAPVSHWDIQDDHGIVQVHPTSRKSLGASYMFDDVFGPDMQNEDVYQEVAMPIIESALTGFNGTIFVYGQTSSGKTFTMMGDRSNPGIVPLAVKNIFRIIEHTPDREYLIRASYMEIYNENISDLLAGRDTRGRSLSIREDLSGTVYVGDLSEECSNCEEQLLEIVKRGEKNRQIASTNMNERSSRSHTIFRLILESRERGDEAQEEGAVTVSHLNLVDLAGSENASQSGATGERLREGGFINKSLFMLGRVISQLSEGDSFVNFRDSKLTRILQTSLGGNSKTAIICTVTPTAVEQTHSTLRFASRAKAIKNKPVVNEVLSDTALLKRYAREIKALQHTLALERNTDKNQEVEQVREMFEEQARRNEELQAKVMELQTKLVVSSLPRGCSQNMLEKKKKARRETWCAPAHRSSRLSLGQPMLPNPPSCVQDYKFVQPMLPPWTETSFCSENACSDTSMNNNENSLSQEEFGKEDFSFVLNQAEKSKLDRQDSLPLESPCLINTSRRKKKVKFDVPSHPKVSDIGCQTEESLMPQMRLFTESLSSTPQGTPVSAKLTGTPSTPSHVLRERNVVLREKLREKEDWLNDWQREMESLKEFHRLEIKTLEESFDGRVAALTDDHPRPESSAQEPEHLKEIASLRRSMQDYEQLLMDANRELSLNVQNSTDLQKQLETLSEENIQLSALQEEVVKLRDENKMLRKDLEVKDCLLTKCENERNDFDMEMELALSKQKQKEEYLRSSLEEAWREIALHGKEGAESMKNWQRPAQLESMVSTATTAQGTTESSDALEQQLVDVQQEADELRVELLEVSQQMEQVKKENDKLWQEVKDLQEHLSEVLFREGSDRILLLKEEEIQNLKKRLEEAEKVRQQRVEGKEEEEECLSSPLDVMSERRGEQGRVSQDFSRALSETIQALEESICVTTPGRHSFGTWIDTLSPTDLEAARPLVETVKAGLSALQEHMQVMEQQQQQQQEVAYVTDHWLQITVEVEKELNTWKTLESFMGDYIFHAMSYRQPEQSSTHACPSPPHRSLEYEAKLATFENPGHLNSKIEILEYYSHENDALSSVPRQTEQHEDTMLDACFLNLGSSSNNMEVKELKGQLELLTQENNELLDLVRALQDTIKSAPLAAAALERKTKTPPDTCISEAVCDESKEEIMELEQDHAGSEILSREEFGNLQESQIEELVTAPEEKCALDGVSWEQEVESASPLSELPLVSKSIAEELQQARMNLTMLSETFETSVVVPANITSPSSDVLVLRQQLCVLEQEKIQLQGSICSLQDTLRLMKEKKSSINEKSAEEKAAYIGKLESEVQRLKEESLAQTTCVKTLQDELNARNSVNKVEIQDSTATVLEEEKYKLELKVYELEEKLRYQNEGKEVQEEVNHVRDQIHKLEEEKLALETKLLKLDEKLSCMNLMEEELHSLHWQVTTVKEEKSDVEKELAFMQHEVEKLTEENEKLSAKTKCEVQLGSERDKESDVSPGPDHIDTESEKANILQQKTKELEEAKEEIQVLKREVEEMQRVLEESCGDIRNEDYAREMEEKIMELERTKECLQEEVEKISAKYQNELAEKENELEMVITNFMDKEEAFENTEEELKKANADLKDTLANKDLELDRATHELEEMRVAVSNKDKMLQNLKNKQEEEYFEVTAELEDMKEALIKKDMKCQSQRVNSQQYQMKVEADHMSDNKVMSDLKENLQTLKQKYGDLQSQNEEKLLEAQASLRMFEEKYNNCLQDYIVVSQACEENELMLLKFKEEKEILESKVKRCEEEKGDLQLKYENELHKSKFEKEKHESEMKKYEEEKENLRLKYENELHKSELVREKLESKLKKYEEERENLRLKYENELQQLEEEKDNLTVKYKCEIQKHVEQKENLILKYESEMASATAAEKLQSREALGCSFQSAMEQKLDEIEALKDNLEEKVKECYCLKDTVDNLKVVLAKKQEEQLKLMAEHQEEVAFYADNLSEKEKMTKDLENETKRKSEEVSRLTSALAAKDHCLHRLEDDFSHMRKEMEDKETEFQEGMDHLKKDIEELCAERSRMSENIRSLEEVKETITYECSSLRALRDNLEEDFLQIKEELEAGKNEIQLKQEVICSLETAQERLKEQLDNIKEKETEHLDQQMRNSLKIEKLVEEIEKYKCEMLVKEDQILALNEDLANKTENSERLVRDLQELHEQLEDKCREEKEVKRRLQVVEEKLKRSMAEADKMQVQIMQLSAAKDQILTFEKCRNLEMCKSLGKQQGQQPGEDQETDVVETKACKEMIHEENYSDVSIMKKSSGHNKVCEDCTHFKSLVERLYRLVEEKETEHERKMAEVAVQHSKSVNASLSDTSANTSTQGMKKNRVALMKQENDRLSEQLMQYYEKVKRLEEMLDNMRRTNGVISLDVDVQRELSWMWEKMQEAEKKLKLLNENYDLLEIENEELRKSKVRLKIESEEFRKFQVQLTREKKTEATENYDSLKNNHDSLQDELHSLQKKYSALHENYTTLQETYDTLQENHRMLQEIHSSVQAAHNILQETHNTLQDKYSSASNKFEALQEKYNVLKAHSSFRDSSNDNTLSNQESQCPLATGKPPVVAAVSSHSESGHLRECLAAAERENDELKFRLMANDAPSRKKVELLTEELRVAERKISHLKGELRRQQEVNRGDSTIYELTDQSKPQQQEEGKAKAEPDYTSGNSIVTQVVVMELQNKLYHMEKSKKKLESELKVVQQHVDHYLTKAREWKGKATKEEQAAQKARKERDEIYTELKKYMAKAEDLDSKLERQQFELGHQRELIQKMEKVSPSSISAASATPGFVEVWSTPASKDSREVLVTPALAATGGGIGRGMMATPGAVEEPGRETEGNVSVVLDGTDTAKDKDKHKQDEKLVTRLLGLHNAPLSYHTRAEKLPFMKDIQSKETRDEVPMWKKSRKENEDIKYRLPPEERRKPNEDCKTQ